MSSPKPSTIYRPHPGLLKEPEAFFPNRSVEAYNRELQKLANTSLTAAPEHRSRFAHMYETMRANRANLKRTLKAELAPPVRIEFIGRNNGKNRKRMTTRKIRPAKKLGVVGRPVYQRRTGRADPAVIDLLEFRGMEYPAFNAKKGALRRKTHRLRPEPRKVKKSTLRPKPGLLRSIGTFVSKFFK